MPAASRRDPLAWSVTAVRYAVGLLLVAFAVFGLPSAGPRQTAVVSGVQEPSSVMKSVVQPVTRVVAKMSPLDRLWLQHIYENAAKVTAADGITEQKTIETTAGLRAVHVAILKFIWKGMAENQPGEYEDLDSAINQVFNSVIGDSDRGLTPELRRKAVEMFEAIAWAGLGKDQ